MQVLQVIIATVVSTGIIAAFMHHFYDKRLRTHELKLRRYMELIKELSNLMGSEADFDKLRPLLSEYFSRRSYPIGRPQKSI